MISLEAQKMLKLLEIWIFNNRGNILFHQVYKGSNDPKRTAKINRHLYVKYGENIKHQENEIEILEIDNFRLGILNYPSKNLNLAGLVEQHVSQKKLSSDLTMLSEKFMQKFYSELKHNANQENPEKTKETNSKIDIFLKEWIGLELKQEQAKKVLDML